MSVWVVVRTHANDPWLEETLTKVKSQSLPTKILLMNNNRGGELEESCRNIVDKLVLVPDGEYVPGRVLNYAMEATGGPIVVFLNADCPPCDERWLENLLKPFEEPGVAAVFGRQNPRRDCFPPLARDTEETFGDGERQARWRQCFSMASSAVRRRVWEENLFSSEVQYSEDIEWTHRISEQGYRLVYAADSQVEHSHNYTLRQYYRRQYGEGKADSQIFAWGPWRGSFLRYSLLPFGRQSLADLLYCLRRGSFLWLFLSPLYRFSGMLGRRRGFLQGRRVSS